MELNVEQLNCLSRIVAEELKKRCEKFSGRVELTDDTGQTHLTKKGGKVCQVNFAREVFGGAEAFRWYLIYPHKSDNHIVCYPHISQAEIFTPKLGTAEQYEHIRDKITYFQQDNRSIQEFLASISRGIGEGEGGVPKDKYWIIAPQKLFL